MILSGLKVVGRILGGIAPPAFDYWISQLYDPALSYHMYSGSAVADADNNVYSTGTQFVGSNRLYVMKQDAAGTILWKKTFATSGTGTFGDKIKLDASGNIYIAGRAGIGGYSSGFLIKFDTNGNRIWQFYMAVANNQVDFYDFDFDSIGNICVVGRIGFNTQNGAVWKFSPAGAKIWERSLNSGGDTDYFQSVRVDSSDNIYAVGRTDGQGGASNNIALVKYNSGGAILMQAVYSTAASDIGLGVLVDTSGNIYVLSQTTVSGSATQNALMKVDLNGTIIWQKHFGGTGTELPVTMAFGDNGIYIVGTTNSQTAGGNDILIAKFDTNGNVIWQNRLGSTVSEGAPYLSVGADNTLYIAFDNNVTRSRSFLAKLPGDGTLQGTYGPFVYATTTLPVGNTAYTAIVSSLPNATVNNSISAGTVSLTDMTVTQILYDV